MFRLGGDLFLGARDRCDANGRGAGTPESCRAGAGGGAGGVDIVDQQDVPAVDLRGPGDDKGGADIHAALMGGEAGLTFGGTLPGEESG